MGERSQTQPERNRFNSPVDRRRCSGGESERYASASEARKRLANWRTGYGVSDAYRIHRSRGWLSALSIFFGPDQFQRRPLHSGARSTRGKSLSRPPHCDVRSRSTGSIPATWAGSEVQYRRWDSGSAFAGADSFCCQARRGEAYQGGITNNLPDALYAEWKRDEGPIGCWAHLCER